MRNYVLTSELSACSAKRQQSCYRFAELHNIHRNFKVISAATIMKKSVDRRNLWK